MVIESMSDFWEEGIGGRIGRRYLQMGMWKLGVREYLVMVMILWLYAYIKLINLNTLTM